MSLGPYLIPATLIFRFLTVGLAAGADTVIVILRLTPFKFAVTVADPFFFLWDKIVSGNGKYRRLAGFCIFDGQIDTALQIDKGTHADLGTNLECSLGSAEGCYGF